MPTHSRRRSPPATRRRALELLAASRDGCTERVMMVHGFSVDILADMVRAKLAAAKIERVMAGGRPTEVVGVRITDAGSHSRSAPSKARMVPLILKRASESRPSHASG
jgi:hypothetical protein